MEDQKALKEKIEALDKEMEEDQESEESEDDDDQNRLQVDDKVDGLLQYQLNLPVSSTKFKHFQNAMRNCTNNQRKMIYSQFKKHFQDEIVWQTNENKDIDIGKLFASSYF